MKKGIRPYQKPSIKKEKIRLNYFLQDSRFLDFFNIMNDLEIPVIMTLLVDQYGVGQVINTGFYSNLKIANAVISSIEDAIYQRFFYRRDITRNTNPEDFIEIQGQRILDHIFKSKIYIRHTIYNNLKHVFENTNSEMIPVDNEFLSPDISPQEELKVVISKLKKKGFDIWYSKLSIPHIKLPGLSLYKVIIPGLQPTIPGIPISGYYQERQQSVVNFYKRSKYYV